MNKRCFSLSISHLVDKLKWELRIDCIHHDTQMRLSYKVEESFEQWELHISGLNAIDLSALKLDKNEIRI